MAYPSSIASLSDKSDGPGNIIYAAHVNAIHTALRDLRTVIGDDPEGNLVNLQARLAISLNANGQLIPAENVLLVAKSNAQYSSIQTAINAVSGESSDNPFAIVIFPGSYNEKVTTKSYVNLVGICPHTVLVNAPIGEYALIHNGGNLLNINFMGQVGTGAAYIQTTITSHIFFCDFYGTTYDLFHIFSGTNNLSFCRLWNLNEIAFFAEGGSTLFHNCTMISNTDDIAKIEGGSVTMRLCNAVSNSKGVWCVAPGTLIARLNMWSFEPYGTGTITLGSFTNTNCNY
jgi:hypothetical protein